MAADAKVMAAAAPALPLWRQWTQTKSFKELVRDIWDDNPTFRMILAMCPTMGVTNMAINGLTMGVATMVSTIASSVTVSLVRNVVPIQVRIAVYMIIIAAWVTVIDIVLALTVPDLRRTLAAYVGLIITNCFVLGRAEAYACKNGPWLSAMDATGVGIGFTLSLTLLGVVRELLGFGTVFGLTVFPIWTGWILMILPSGAFFAAGVYVGLVRQYSPGGTLGGAS